MEKVYSNIIKKAIFIVALISALVSISSITLIKFVFPLIRYNQSVKLMENKEYDQAIEGFSQVLSFRNSAELTDECRERIKKDIYSEAQTKDALFHYAEAYKLYNSLGDYLDSAECAENSRIKMQNELLKNAVRKDTVVFGTYEQDNNTENGKELIEWYVIIERGNWLLLFSKNILDCKQFNTEYEGVTWKESTIRKWLNEDFYNAAFSENDKKFIMKSWINSEHKDESSENVRDCVFLPSVTEVNNNVPITMRNGYATEYAISQGAHVDPDTNASRWLLRTPGQYSFYNAIIYFDGSINRRGNDVNYSQDGIRPCVWISRSTLINSMIKK